MLSFNDTSFIKSISKSKQVYQRYVESELELKLFPTVRSQLKYHQINSIYRVMKSKYNSYHSSLGQVEILLYLTFLKLK